MVQRSDNSGGSISFVCGRQGALTSIHQPVLTWGDETEGGIGGWHIWSWTCCPKNVTWHSEASLFSCSPLWGPPWQYHAGNRGQHSTALEHSAAVHHGGAARRVGCSPSACSFGGM